MDSSIVKVKKFSRYSVKEDVEFNYIFTDNSARRSGRFKNKVIEDVGETWYVQKYGPDVTFPGGSQAVIRGLENAFPISTMKAEGQQWEEEDFSKFKSIIDDEIETIQSAMKEKPFKVILGKKIGKGKYSKLPGIFQEYLDKKLLTININNFVEE